MTSENMEVISTAIIACESGGQTYGNGDWSAARNASAKIVGEKTITVGAPQFYGSEALTLMKNIFSADNTTFRKLDVCSPTIESMLSYDWVAEKWTASVNQLAAIRKIISSAVGISEQKKLFASQLQKFVYDCEVSYPKADDLAKAYYCEIRHLGGKSAADRIFMKCTTFTEDDIFTALKKDQSDTSSSNQVGDSLYWSRHEAFKKMMAEHFTKESGSMKASAYLIKKYNLPTYSGKTTISNSGHDERGKYKYGTAGDQTGTEWELKAWYNRPWTHVFRYPNQAVAIKIAEWAIRAAQNNHIGYDQEERYTFWDQLKVSNYDPAQITKNCEADCTAGVAGCVKAVGYLLGIDSFKGLDADTYSSNMRKRLQAAGFQTLTDSKYLTSSDYLLAGDILLYENHHACTNVTAGSKAVDYLVDDDGKADNSPTVYASETKLNETQKFIAEATTDVYVRTGAGKEFSKSRYYPMLKKGDRVGVCDTVVNSRGEKWYYIVISNDTVKSYGKTEIHDFSRADYFTKV